MNKIFVTQDGSHSMISEKFGEAYHSKYGAIQESQHVFIKAGLNAFCTQSTNDKNTQDQQENKDEADKVEVNTKKIATDIEQPKAVIKDAIETTNKITDTKKDNNDCDTMQEEQAKLDSSLDKNLVKDVSIFEMGFGTGLNALLSYLYALQHDLHIDYTSIEAFPISNWQSLNYVQQLKDSKLIHKHTAKKLTSFFDNIHAAKWNKTQEIDKYFTLHKIDKDLNETELPPQKFDLIYFDAFAPNAQAELWTETVFEKLYKATKPNGLLTTYCAKGVVKRAIKAVGFEIESLPGPPGKREMTRGKRVHKE